MMKIVSLILFTAVFTWSWHMFHSEDKISYATHAGIQSKLTTLIADTIKTARPSSTNFEMISIYTQKIDDNQISAHFTYKYTDQVEGQDKANQIIKGEAQLFRGLSENADEDKWIAKSVKTSSSSIEFEQALVVTPEPENQATQPATTTTPTEEKKTH